MTHRICTRIYTTNQGSHFKDQLNNWCDRLHIDRIRFTTDLTQFRDGNGHALYQSIPSFPRITDLSRRYLAQGQTESEARNISLSYIHQARLPVSTGSIGFHYQPAGHGLVVAQPYCLIEYGAYEDLTDQYITGWGTSVRKAEEDAAMKLLTSQRYCFY